ncbi:hypothetical protein Tco_1503221 [Tanacetum coccineum]
MGDSSYRRGHYGAPGDAYLFIVAMPNYGGNSIVPSLSYEVGGSSRKVQDDDDGDDGMSDQFVHFENCVLRVMMIWMAMMIDGVDQV